MNLTLKILISLFSLALFSSIPIAMANDIYTEDQPYNQQAQNNRLGQENNYNEQNTQPNNENQSIPDRIKNGINNSKEPIDAAGKTVNVIQGLKNLLKW